MSSLRFHCDYICCLKFLWQLNIFWSFSFRYFFITGENLSWSLYILIKPTNNFSTWYLLNKYNWNQKRGPTSGPQSYPSLLPSHNIKKVYHILPPILQVSHYSPPSISTENFSFKMTGIRVMCIYCNLRARIDWIW